METMETNTDEYVNLYEERRLLEKLMKVNPERYSHMSDRVDEIKTVTNVLYGSQHLDNDIDIGIGPFNRNMTIDELVEIEDLVHAHAETVQDYKTIDFYMSQRGLDAGYFISTFNEKNIFTLEQLHTFRKNQASCPDPFMRGWVCGNILGKISFLKDFFK